MQVLQIEILDPKAERLLRDLAEKELIVIKTDSKDAPRPRRQFGWAKGAFEIPDSFDDPLEEFEEYE